MLTRARDAAVEAVLAGTLAALVEGLRVGTASHAGAGAVPVIAATAALAWIAAALVVRGALAVLVRVPPIGGWARDLGETGAPRVRAAWTAVLLALCVAAFAVTAFRVFTWAHERFRYQDGEPIGLVVVTAYVGLAAALAIGALVVDRIVRPRLPGSALAGRRAHVAAAIAALAGVAGVPLAIGRAVPTLELLPIAVGCVLVAAVIAAVALGLGARRALRWAAPVLVLAVLGGTYVLGRAPSARLAIVEQGAASRVIARRIWALADGDGDRYAGSAVGGADCNDDSAAINPGARDIPGNGIDENCSGADANAATYGMRVIARPAPPVTVRPNIVVISVDALRADRLAKAIELERLAITGVRFTHAYTSCPSTRCAIPALHTGRFSTTLPPLAERDAVPSLASTLASAGYATAAITCCERFAVARGELTGFSHLDATADTARMQRPGQSNADVVVDNALRWLASRPADRPFLLWTHLYEPHYPYYAPTVKPASGAELDRYDAEVAEADAQIGRLVAALDPNNTIVIVTSDHGEELDEHGIRFHARSLYNQVIRVPLIVRAPGIAARTVDAPVSIVDIMPTLLELAGIAGPAGMNGLSLVPALRGQSLPARPILVELVHDHQIARDMAALVSPPWKVIWDREANAWSLYKLSDLADATDHSDDAALPPLQRALQETLDRETGALLR